MFAAIESALGRDAAATPAAPALPAAPLPKNAEKLDRALAEFDSLLARTSANELAVRARFGRAAALQDLERHDEAASEYAEVMKLAEEDPDLKALVPQAMLVQASSLVSAGKADEALKVIWLLELRGDRGAAGLKSKFWKGLAYEAKGQKAKASAAYEQVPSTAGRRCSWPTSATSRATSSARSPRTTASWRWAIPRSSWTMRSSTPP